MQKEKLSVLGWIRDGPQGIKKDGSQTSPCEYSIPRLTSKERTRTWGGKRILSEEWIRRTRVPCPLFANYGYLWWLNTERRRYPSAPAGSYYAIGAGGNQTWIDPEHDLVAVLRWTDPAAMDRFMGLVMAAIAQA